MATTIKLKKTRIKDLNLGQPLSNKIYAGNGRFYKIFENAKIHGNSVIAREAHVLPIDIHNIYNKPSNFGTAFLKGKRLFEFLLSDVIKNKHQQYPVSYFEWGAIYWKNGGVALYGKLYDHWKVMGKDNESSWLGYPLANPIIVAGGEAVFFEFGCLWYGPKSNNEVVEIVWTLPQLGNPWMIKPSELNSKHMTGFQFDRGIISKEDAGNLLQSLFDGRIFLTETGKNVQLQVNVDIALLDEEEKVNNISNYSAPFLPIINERLKNHQLYDVSIKLPDKEMYALSPHSIYAHDNGTDFKFIHATDLHVSKRLDGWRKILKDNGFDKGARVFNNFNDNFREFICYANKLHNRGQLDFILITGDLVDYIFEDGGNTDINNNFVFFRELVLGTAPAPDQEKAEELIVPIFTSLGNHDYRTNAYYPFAQVFEITLPPQNQSFNLIKDEANSITGTFIPPNTQFNPSQEPKWFTKNISKERASLMVNPDEDNKDGSLDYYFKYINKEKTYTIELGTNRILMIDGKWDKDPIDTFWEVVSNYSGLSNDDQEQFSSGSPNSVGFFDWELGKVREYLNRTEGLLIIGVHNPIINPKNGEYPYFLRESIRVNELHITELMRKYLYRRDGLGYVTFENISSRINLSKDIHKDWSQTNTAYFAHGDGDDMLDAAIMRGHKLEFLKLCAGVDVSRPADLILSGHIHDNLECRIKWGALKKKFFFYHDFYTENPAIYYNACDIDIETDKDVSVHKGWESIKNRTIFKQIITNEAGENEPMVRNENGLLVLRKKGYPHPLRDVSTSENVKSWWENIRPLFIQTEAIGPMKSQRGKGPYFQPVFNGCRHITVIDNVIHKIRYDRKEEITNRLSGAEPFEPQDQWLEPVLHMMMR